ncbi:MAG: ATP-binding protein, partial [Myxococcota bacterium]
DHSSAREGFSELERAGRVTAERRLRHFSGSMIPVEVTAFRIYFEGEAAFASLVRDLRPKKAMERQLLFAERMASVGALAAGVAHEINNPLTYVLANTEALEHELSDLGDSLGPQADFLAELVAEIREGAERVRGTVRDLLVFSRDDEGETAVDVRAVLESSISMAANQIKYRARLVTQVGPVPKVFANERRLGQVFLNLLVNAAQALPEGAAHEHEIRVSLVQEGPNVVVRVEDTGPGIPAEHRERIFEPFFTTKPAGVGTGLGLSICYSIVRSLDGTIEVEDRRPRGTAFVVSLPFTETPSMRPMSRRTPLVPPARVLVVDDDPMVLRTISRALRRHRVDTTSDPEEGLVRLETETYDIVLCDIMMPNITGIEVYQRSAERDAELATRFLFMTGGAFSPESQAFLQSKERPLLFKPFRSEELVALINDTFQRLGPRPIQP